jgi:DNA topoisomerase-2
MHAFNHEEKLKKYETPDEIIDDFYEVRLEFYDKRKRYQIEILKNELVILSNKARYIQEILDDTLDLRKKKTREIIEILENKGYDKIEGDDDYKYLVKMPMDSVSEENVEKIMNERDIKEAELNMLKSKDIKTIWSEELRELLTEYSGSMSALSASSELIKAPKKSTKTKSKSKEKKETTEETTPATQENESKPKHKTKNKSKVKKLNLVLDDE